MQQLKALPTRHIFPQILAVWSKINNCSLQAMFFTYSRLRDSSWENVPGWILEILLLCKNLQWKNPCQNIIQYLHYTDDNNPGQNSAEVQRLLTKMELGVLNWLCLFPWAMGILFMWERNAIHRSRERVCTGNGDSRCDVTDLNWNLKVNLLYAVQREEKGHKIPAGWTHPVLSVPWSAPVYKRPFPLQMIWEFTGAAVEVRLQ